MQNGHGSMAKTQEDAWQCTRRGSGVRILGGAGHSVGAARPVTNTPDPGCRRLGRPSCVFFGGHVLLFPHERTRSTVQAGQLRLGDFGS